MSPPANERGFLWEQPLEMLPKASRSLFPKSASGLVVPESNHAQFSASSAPPRESRSVFSAPSAPPRENAVPFLLVKLA
jgi:hypothetical protein